MPVIPSQRSIQHQRPELGVRRELAILRGFFRLWPHALAYKMCPEKDVIDDDLRRWTAKRGYPPWADTQALVLLLLVEPYFRNVFYLRARNLHGVWRKFAPHDRSCRILGSTQCGGGLLLYHAFSTIVNARAIGRNCTLRNNTTIGNVQDDNTRLPVLKDDVNVGANAVIIGEIVIGNDVTIGAGAVVTKNVPDGCVVAGNPARIIRRNGVKVSEPLE